MRIIFDEPHTYFIYIYLQKQKNNIQNSINQLFTVVLIILTERSIDFQLVTYVQIVIKLCNQIVQTKTVNKTEFFSYSHTDGICVHGIMDTHTLSIKFNHKSTKTNRKNCTIFIKSFVAEIAYKLFR